jgi:hypothetical protein
MIKDWDLAEKIIPFLNLNRLTIINWMIIPYLCFLNYLIYP